MKIPSYLMTELVNRLNRGNVDEVKTLEVLKTVGLDLDEPGPAPDFAELTSRYEGPTKIGSFTLDATLELFGHRSPMHFRINYAIPLDSDEPGDMLFGTSICIDQLTWGEFVEHEPSWTPMAPNIFSDEMRARLEPMIVRHVRRG
ncbi:MAG: hypothetical protein E2586_20845 [Novosphingobium sp.]|uniref:hypothetical protein n=1 Tax=Novosphingobium sp. TaxID=1874826 RepID=UPI0012BEFAB4|nr:hypothetical protein [Novosphingobium sp.]MPS70930.1 hypothetical protein [Novosphingobium sp.]